MLDNNQRNVLLDWMRKIHQMEYAHRFESIRWNNRNYWLGIPALILAAIVGAVSGLCEIDDTIKNIITSIAGVVVAVLTGLQTFMKPQEYSEKHKATSFNYEKLRHKIEFILHFETDTDKIKLEAEKIKNEWNSIETLNVSNENYNLAKKRVSGFNKYPEELDFLQKNTA